MRHWVLLGAVGAAAGWFEGYWAAAPQVMRAALVWLPVCIAADGVLTLVHTRVVRAGEKRLPQDTWQAVTVRFVLTAAGVALGLAADAIGGLGYSFVPLALLWGYTTHVASTIRHVREVAAVYGIVPAGWLDEIAQVGSGRVNREHDG